MFCFDVGVGGAPENNHTDVYIHLLAGSFVSF